MEEPVEVTETEASGGSKPSPTRWVMIVSIVLVTAAFVAAFAYFSR